MSPTAIDGLLADAEEAGVGIDGQGGLLQQMMKAALERALQVELADHFGYAAGDPTGRGSGNSRGIRRIEGRHIDGDGPIPKGRVRGTGTLGWKRALNHFMLAFPDRLPL